FGTGKTQLCHTLCVMVQQARGKGGLGGRAVYVDTENTFRPERIVSIARARGLGADKALEGIIVAKAYNSAHQELIIEETGPVIEENGVKLVVIDSAVAHYRAEFLGRATLSERQQRLNKFMHILVRMAETYGVAVVVTNQIQSSPDAYFGDAARPTGGNVVAHTSTYRIYLKRSSGKNRIARMVDSPYHAEREVLFTLSDKGITDVDEG
ncbi:DNA repair and recombination protein RadA, partial [Nitrososphaera sp.]|uniref:DNA repair and recombination protein RadA n=1 Tax=Nitrososphaera sp. TaxID=1971748 RepID=UPI00307D9C03